MNASINLMHCHRNSQVERGELARTTHVAPAELDEVAGLAVEHVADRLQGFEPNPLGLARLEDREVGQGDADLAREVGERHAPSVQHVVDLDEDGHQIIARRSSRWRAPCSNTLARTKVRRTASHPAGEKSHSIGTWEACT